MRTKNQAGHQTPGLPRLRTTIQEPLVSQVLVRAEQAAGNPHQHHRPPDLHVLLLEDLLVLLQKQDEKLLLKCHSKTAVGSSDSKQTFSPVLKLNAVLVRSVATGTHEETAPAGPGPRPCTLVLTSSERWVMNLLACLCDFPSTLTHLSRKMWFSMW